MIIIMFGFIAAFLFAAICKRGVLNIARKGLGEVTVFCSIRKSIVDDSTLSIYRPDLIVRSCEISY